MLNVGRLSPDAADYYLGEVATSAESYYLGQGEGAGRWVGSLTDRLGLRGQVEAADFRAVLEGRHPRTGEPLLSGRGSSGRAQHPRRPPDPQQGSLLGDEFLDVPRVAARLQLSTRRVRQLLCAGERNPTTGRRCRPFLVGQRLPGGGSIRPGAWVVRQAEVERFESARRRTKARPGYDLTLRPPKSVSILWALGTPEQRRALREAHRSAVDAVVAYYESHAVYARRGTRDRGRIETAGMVAAAFDHRTSRAGDPLLHTHVVVANMTLTANGRWQTVDGRALYEHARSGGFLYQSHLRHALTARLGLRWGRIRNGHAEIDGVPSNVIAAFSKRRDEIEDMVAESGWTSARAHQAAALATRTPKDPAATPETLEEGWRAEAAALGFGAEAVRACFGHGSEPQEPDIEQLFDSLAGPQGLTARASTFSRREVIEALAEGVAATADAARIEQLADTFLASGRVQPLASAPAQGSDLVWRCGGGRERSPDLARYSTPELLRIESRVMAWARDGFGSPAPVAAEHEIARVLGERGQLTDEQRTMVRRVCSDTASIQVVAGRPGAGKTFATAACVDAFLSSGVSVAGCALSATAAAELEAATGLGRLSGRPATTIARLLLDVEHQRDLPTGVVLFVDEASMVGTRDLARLAGHVARVGGSLKLIGDPDQHGPVETGGLFRVLTAGAGPGGVSLVGNHRQTRHEDRQAIEEYRQELVESALARYDAAGQVVRSPNAAASYDAMVADWYEGYREGSTDPMIAGPNRIRWALNARARRRLKAEGRLGGPTVTANGREFCRGDWIVTRRNARHLRSPIDGAFVKNGSAGTVIALDPEARTLTVDFAAEGHITLPTDYLDGGWVEHGYARTTYGVQGATLTRALYHPGDVSSFEEGYVALTRGRVETRIYIVDGALAVDDEVGHPGHEIEESGLETVCEALAERRSRTLAHEADPDAAAVRDAYHGWSLAELRAERSRLAAVLNAGPASVEGELQSAIGRRDALLARRQSWTRRLETLTGRGPTKRAIGGRSQAAARAQRELDAIERSMLALDARLSTLRQRHAARGAYLRDHADDVTQLALARKAESNRELQLRLRGALQVSPHRSPTRAEEHHRLRHEVERLLIRSERAGHTTDHRVSDPDYRRTDPRTRPDPPEPSFEDFRPPAESEPGEPSLF